MAIKQTFTVSLLALYTTLLTIGLALGLGYGEQRDQNGGQHYKARSEQTFAVASYTVGDLYFGGLYKYGLS